MAWFTRYLVGRASSLGFAELGDYAPSRDRSLAGGSLYTFKAKGNEYREEISPTNTRRGRLRKFVTCAFGEVDAAYTMSDGRGVCIRLRAPAEGSCSVSEAFGGQLKFLRDVLGQHNRSGRVRGSWFATDTLVNVETKDGCFYVFMVTMSASATAMLLNHVLTGKLIQLEVSFQRLDLPANGGIESEYSLLGHHLVILNTRDFPTRGQGYQCDGEKGNSCRASVLPCEWESTMFTLTQLECPLRQTGPAVYMVIDLSSGSSPFWRMVFSGCISSLVFETTAKGARQIHITLSCPRFPNTAAIELVRMQEAFLNEIAEADTNAKEQPCNVSWGPDKDQYIVPTVVITIAANVRQLTAQGNVGTVGHLYDFSVGTDVTVGTCLTRTEEVIKGVRHLTYCLKGSIYGLLRPTELREQDALDARVDII
ncbi:hypothetical protein C8R47DRAFT_1083933 [Mycena vitilis]|nr:hypothetical protein C8R47DRAFT_1083933 [Mycena vitilis]